MTKKEDGFFDLLGLKTIRFGRDCKHAVTFLGELAVALLYAASHPHKIRWRDTLYYMNTCGINAIPIVGLICFLVGVILAFQGGVVMSQFDFEIYLADSIAISVVKEFAPLMVAIIATGRAGSAFAAEIGTMKVSEEINALVTMGFVPSRFLIVPKMLAMIIVSPILTLIGIYLGIIGGMIITDLVYGVSKTISYNHTIAILTPMHLIESMTKSIVFAFLISAVGCMRGFEATDDAQGVGQAATSAVVSGIFLIILADTLLTVVFNFG